jgi:Putative transposase of IS4/5 family (DUF4096)
VKEQTYPTDLTGSKWDHIKELVPGAKPGGRRRTVEVREVINALLYVDNNGIKWRALPVMTRKANASCLKMRGLPNQINCQQEPHSVSVNSNSLAHLLPA